MKRKLIHVLAGLFFAILVMAPAWGQYSAADCTGPQVVGTDRLFIPECTNGIRFRASIIPTGTFHTFLVTRKPPTAPNDLRFHFGSAENDPQNLFGLMTTENQLRKFNPNNGTGDIYVFSSRDLGGDTVNEVCQQNNGGLPIRGCPTSYGRFFDIDGNRDGRFDDMEVVFIDGRAVPLNFRILFVPMNWAGTQALFDATAHNQVNAFAGSTGLGSCLNTIEVVTLDVNTQNFNTFACTAANTNLQSVRDFIRGLGLKTISYDLVVGMLPVGGSPCNPIAGVSNTVDTIWIEPDVDTTLAHEIGHIYSLEDEYCSEQAGGDNRCAGGSGSINFLDPALGCNPNTGLGCCNCTNPGAPPGTAACSAACDTITPASNYHVCCAGNDGARGGGTKCIMAAVGAGAGVQNWCQRCLGRLNGRTEFKCDTTPTNPFRDVLAVDLTLSRAGNVKLNAVEIGKGRPTRIDPQGDRFQVTLDAPSGNLLSQAFDINQYDVKVPQEEGNFHYQVPIGFSPDNPPPVVLTVLDNGKATFRGTLFGNSPIANAGPDKTAECSGPTGAPVTLDASSSSDPDGDMLHFQWSAPDVAFNDASNVAPTGQFPSGTTVAQLTVSDGVFEASDTATVVVRDSTPPLITLNGPAEMTLQCHVDAYTELGARVADVCDPQVTTAVVGGDSVNVKSPGVYVVTYNAVDTSGNAAIQATRKVSVVDTIPPSIEALTVDQNRLWPPNHQMIPVTVTAKATDLCDMNTACKIVSVRSNEPVDGLGDGDTQPDWEITGNLTVKLRAERAGSGNGREYTIAVQCTDASGNRSEPKSVTVMVPHDRGKK